MVIPILGISPRRSLADALFTRTQQRVLGLLFGQPHRSFSTSEIIRLTKGGSGAIQRELAVLDEAGLVEVIRIGNQLTYGANRQSPIFEELTGMVIKTVGLAEPIRKALGPLASRIRAAFVFGSVAKRTDRSSSDIDLMTLADDLTYAEIFGAIEPLHDSLGRTVNPTVYTPREFAKRRESGDAFVTRVLASPRIWILGSEDDLVV